MNQPSPTPRAAWSAVRSRAVGWRAAVHNRLAAVAVRSGPLRTLYAKVRSRLTGRRRRRTAAGSARMAGGESDRLRRSLQLLRQADGSDTPELRSEVRQLATRTHIGDSDGLAIEALTLLADRYHDRTARAWLAPVLAHAGQFAEAADRGVDFAPGRPRARTYVIMVTALQQLGRDQEAEQLMRSLERRFPALSEQFVDIWRQDRLSSAYRELYQSSPARRGLLPVFQHLPFCAGTSMQVALKQVLPWARELQITRHWGLLDIERALGLPAADVAELMLVRQHHPYPLELPGRTMSHLTVLRDPVSQIRSGYYKRAQREGIVLTRDVGSQSFTEHVEYRLAHGLTNLLSRMLVVTHPDFRPAFRQHFHSSRAYTKISFEEDMFLLDATRQLGDDRLLALCREILQQDFHLVGTMKHIAASHLAFTAAAGVPVAHRIVHRGRSGQPEPTEPGSVERRLREANAVDQQLYQEYTARFEHEHAALIDVVEGGAVEGGES